jgi:hypothetical protein
MFSVLGSKLAKRKIEVSCLRATVALVLIFVIGVGIVRSEKSISVSVKEAIKRCRFDSFSSVLINDTSTTPPVGTAHDLIELIVGKRGHLHCYRLRTPAGNNNAHGMVPAYVWRVFWQKVAQNTGVKTTIDYQSFRTACIHDIQQNVNGLINYKFFLNEADVFNSYVRGGERE